MLIIVTLGILGVFLVLCYVTILTGIIFTFGGDDLSPSSGWLLLTLLGWSYVLFKIWGAFVEGAHTLMVAM